jgi:sigma-B regulation protein RsbU (phosphoserine phosphatase)
MNRGACDFITKPIDFKDLEITIFNAIEQCLTLKKAMEAQAMLSDLEKELAIAYHIQQSIIPHHFPSLFPTQNFDILGKMIPAQHVGGDFFDFFQLDPDHLGFLIADVSGKGIPAALFMAMARAIIRAVAQKDASPQTCLKEANRILCIDNESCMFVTCFYGILNTKTGIIECANAGHNPPVLLQSDLTLQTIARNEGIPLGVSAQTTYIQHSFQLKKDDYLILYTDGITEAMNTHQNLYTEHRFLQSLKNWHPNTLVSLIDHILDDLSRFTAGAASSDDITLLCLKQLN